MRFLWCFLFVSVLVGCAQEAPVEARARGLASVLAQRIKGINTNLPPPKMDPEGPSAPDNAKVAAASIKITKMLIEDLEKGSGRLAEEGKVVYVRYRGELPDGFVFDSNRKPNQQMLSFTIGAREVVLGLEQGIVGMRVGGRRKITMPGPLGYGEHPREGSRIPPNAALIFYVDLLFVATPKEE